MEPSECSRGRGLPSKVAHSTLDDAPATAGRRTSERTQCLKPMGHKPLHDNCLWHVSLNSDLLNEHKECF